jgi:hypothetical protein
MLPPSMLLIISHCFHTDCIVGRFTMMSDNVLIDHLCAPTPWTHPLSFMMISEDEIAMEKEPEPKPLDLMSISEITYKGPYRYYFPRKYKPSDAAGHQMLTDDLRLVGLFHGVKLARTGGGRGRGVYPMLCKCAVFYRPYAAAKGATKTDDFAGFTYKADIKVQSLVNDRKNCRARRANGEPLAKKCRTGRPKKGSGVTCKAKLTFFADPKHDRFCIKAYNGNRFHSNHHQVKASDISVGLNDLSDETVQLVQSMHKAQLNRSSVRNLVFQKSGVVLTGDQIALIKRRLAGPNIVNAPGVSKKVNDLLDVLGKEPNLKFCLLFHDAPEHIKKSMPLIVGKGGKRQMKPKRGSISCETYDGADQTKDGLEGVRCVSAVVDDAVGAHEEAELIRMEHKIGSKGRLLLAIVWATADGIANFAKYPETLGGDTTWGTNAERRPLIQFVGTDGMGRSFPAVQGFLPHEKGFIFDWLLQEALPSLLGRENCAKTSVILTDGDQTEIAAVDTACASLEVRGIIKVMLHEAVESATSTERPNQLAPVWTAMHRTCYFHAVTQKLPRLRCKSQEGPQAEACWDVVHRWMNSLSLDVETCEEFQISRRLLELWIKSDDVRAQLGEMAVHSTLEYMARSIFTHENKWAGYVYLRQTTMGQRTTSPNEGENAVIKAKGTGVKNNSSLADSTQNILTNSKVRAANKHIRAMAEYTTTPTWSDSPWSTRNTSKGEGLLQQSLKGSLNYDNVRVARKKWYSRAKMSCYPPLSEYDPVTRFLRTRTVEIIDIRGEPFIVCDCYRYNRTKIACGHIINVLQSLGADLSLFHLAGIRWSTAYLINYGSPDISEELRNAFERSLQHVAVPVHPSTKVNDWAGVPIFSCSELTMNDFCPCSLNRPPIIYNYKEEVTANLHHLWSPALGANVSQVLVTTQSFTSPVIGKSDPLPLVTPEFPVIQTQDLQRSLPDSPPQDCWNDSGHEDDGDLSEVSPNESTNMISVCSVESHGKKRPAYFDFKHDLSEMCRLSEGHEHAEEFIRCNLLVTKGLLSASHSNPSIKKRMEEFSKEIRALLSEGEPTSHEKGLSQLQTVLLPKFDVELHSFNASVETKSKYTRKRGSG